VAPAGADPARAVAALFSEYADLLEVLGRDAHKAPAYRRAARALRDWPEDLRATAAAGRLQEIPGIGPTLARKVEEFLGTGRLAALERLRAEVPPGVRDLLRIRGVGPRLAARVWRELGVADLAALEAACADGRLAALPGVGPRRAAEIRAALAAHGEGAPLAYVARLAEDLAAALVGHAGVVRAEPAGAVRRAVPWVSEAVVVAEGTPPAVAAALGATGAPWEEVPRALGTPWPGWRGLLPVDGRPLVVWVLAAPATAWGTALCLATGAPAHLEDLAARAAAPPWPEAPDEPSFYRALGLPWIPPELREGEGEVAAAAAGTLAPPAGRWVELGDLRGDLHCHSTWSDGHADLPALAEAARRRGYRYLAVTDHSGSLAVAHGLDPQRLAAQRQAIDAWNAGHTGDGPVLLQGAEVEILRDGRLDYPPEALFRLDFCLAALHQTYGQSGPELTRRLLAALEHPAVDLVAHPTGRLLGERPPQPVDLDALADAAARLGKALEIDGSPERLDLDAAAARRAAARGVPYLSLSSDAHTLDGLGDVRWAVATARRAGLGPDRILNALPLEALRAWRARRLTP
jgi:DNA polymerase (family 10)